MIDQSVVVWAGAWLAGALALLVSAPAPRPRSEWIGSVALTGSLALAAWLASGALSPRPAPPLGVVAVASLCLGAATSIVFRSWDAVGRTVFGAAAVAATVFIMYAGALIDGASMDGGSIALSLLLLGLETAALLLLLGHTFEVIDVTRRTRWPRRTGPRRVPGYVPKVSIHVPVHDEPPDLVAETLQALSGLEYDNYEVLVIDNNTADERQWRPLERLCRRLGGRFRFFHISPWPGYKAGALNFALAHSASDADIVAVVDADYIVSPNFLTDLVGHFVDATVGFVQTPQDYRDTKRGEFGRALYLAYQYFFKVSMVSRNEHDAIIYGGTMGLIRRSALDAVGGWNEWCISEDAELSLRLLAAGYRSLYVEQSYGHGLMPLDYAGLRRQRYRWAFGGMQILRLHWRALLNPRARNQLSAAQRGMYLLGALQWLNDPLALAFTVLLLVGGWVYALSGTLSVQPLAGAVVLIPPLFVFFAVLRFGWALRSRTMCTWSDAARALTVMLGLTWVVTVACARGLTASEGVFLRTPKERGQPGSLDVLRVARWELSIGLACIVTAGVLTVAPGVVSATAAVITGFLGWQAVMYLSAVQTGLWSAAEERAARKSSRHLRDIADAHRAPLGVERWAAARPRLDLARSGTPDT